MTADTLSRERVARIVRLMPALVGVGTGTSSEADAEVSVVDLLKDYYRVMEIAHYIRRGGVKAMIYRVETGRTRFMPSDYFDEANERLIASLRQTLQPEQAAEPVLDRLRQVTEDEEKLVAEFLPQIDSILLADKRRQAAPLMEDSDR